MECGHLRYSGEAMKLVRFEPLSMIGKPAGGRFIDPQALTGDEQSGRNQKSEGKKTYSPHRGDWTEAFDCHELKAPYRFGVLSLPKPIMAEGKPCFTNQRVSCLRYLFVTKCLRTASRHVIGSET